MINVESDLDTFEAFYRREFNNVFRLAWSLTGSWAVAEEIAQDAFLAVSRGWDRLHAYDRPSAWVRRVTLNNCVSAARRRTTERRMRDRLSLARPAPQGIEITEATDEVWREVRRLPARQAQTIALLFLEDRTVDEAAAILGCGEATVRTHLRRAKQTLAERLNLNEEDR